MSFHQLGEALALAVGHVWAIAPWPRGRLGRCIWLTGNECASRLSGVLPCRSIFTRAGQRCRRYPPKRSIRGVNSGA